MRLLSVPMITNGDQRKRAPKQTSYVSVAVDRH